MMSPAVQSPALPRTSYEACRARLTRYFDSTAREAWTQLTSDAPVSRVRATVRAGRDRMRETLLSWLPDDLTGLRLLDAGCGTGALSVAAARRGAHVVAVDVAGGLVDVARARAATLPGAARIDWHVGDMLDPGLGSFDHVIAMDSLIHYRTADIVTAIAALGTRTRGAMLMTFAPRTPALTMMHAAGKLFPRRDRAPAIEPVGEMRLYRAIAVSPSLAGWKPGRARRVSGGFYTSQALELVRR